MTAATPTAPSPTPQTPAQSQPEPFVPPRQFARADDWLHSLGDIPLNRIRFTPWPGTATQADLLHYVERKESLCELIDGTLVDKAVGFWEGQIAAELSAALVGFSKPRGMGLVCGADSTLRMAGGNIRLPDVAFISTDRVPKTREAVPAVSPDLAIEVLSQTNTPAEITRKMREYFDSGTRLAWILDPVKKQVAVHHHADEPTRVLDESQTLDGEEVLPGFTFAVKDLFRTLPDT